MRILHGAIFIMHTIIFPGPRNDYLPFRTVCMYVEIPENAIFDLLQVIISKRVQSVADKFRNYVPNTLVNPVEIIGLVIIYVGWYLS